MIAEALACMALNIYHEARNESTIGQVAVAQVVMNRVGDDGFPDTPCEVIYDGKHYTAKSGRRINRDRCQFSWYCDGLADRPVIKRHTRLHTKTRRQCSRATTSESWMVLRIITRIMFRRAGRNYTHELSRLTLIFFTGGTNA